MRAGELRFAVGVSGRRNSFLFEPSEINDNVSVIEQPQGIFVANNAEGETEVKEIYGELLVPLTERLDLEFGYRYSDYDASGGARYLEGAVQLRRDRRCHPSRRFPIRDARAERGRALFGPGRFDRGLPAQRSLLVHDARAVGQHRCKPESTAGAELCIDIIGSDDVGLRCCRAARGEQLCPTGSARSSRSRTRTSRAIRTSCRKKPTPGRSASC